MISITFGEVTVDKSNTTFGRLVVSNNTIGAKESSKNIFLVLNNASVMLGSAGDIKELNIIDSSSGLVICSSLMTLHNIEIEEKENKVSYNYTFVED